jgi:hypothetical protein
MGIDRPKVSFVVRAVQARGTVPAALALIQCLALVFLVPLQVPVVEATPTLPDQIVQDLANYQTL